MDISGIFWTKTKTLTWGREGLGGWLGGMGPPVDMWIMWIFGYVDYVDMWICGYGYIFKDHTWSWGLPRTGLSISQCCGGDLHLDVLDFFWKSKVNAPTRHQKQKYMLAIKEFWTFQLEFNLSPFSSQLCGSHSLKISDVYEKVFRFPLNFDPHTCAKSLLVTFFHLYAS